MAMTELEMYAKIETFIKRYQWKWRYSQRDWQELVKVRDSLKLKAALSK